MLLFPFSFSYLGAYIYMRILSRDSYTVPGETSSRWGRFKDGFALLIEYRPNYGEDRGQTGEQSCIKVFFLVAVKPS